MFISQIELISGSSYLVKICLTLVNKNKDKKDPLRAVNILKGRGDEPYRGFGYLSLFSNPKDLATRSQKEILLFCIFQQGNRYKD